ncbi:argonaute 5, partial [Ancistrocladus abbreviatus]
GSACPFYDSIMVTKFIQKYLNLRQLSRPLSDADRMKVKRVLRGIKVETNYRGYIKRFKVNGIS